MFAETEIRRQSEVVASIADRCPDALSARQRRELYGVAYALLRNTRGATLEYADAADALQAIAAGVIDGRVQRLIRQTGDSMARAVSWVYNRP